MGYLEDLKRMLRGKRYELKALVLKADPLVADIHVAANPHVPVQKVDADGILARAQDLKKNVDKIRKLAAEITEIEKELGESSGA